MSDQLGLIGVNDRCVLTQQLWLTGVAPNCGAVPCSGCTRIALPHSYLLMRGVLAEGLPASPLCDACTDRRVMERLVAGHFVPTPLVMMWARVGDVFRHRDDGDLCRITAVQATHLGEYLTDLHDGTFGAPSSQELARRWERVARDVSEEAFRAMRCTCARCTATDAP